MSRWANNGNGKKRKEPNYEYKTYLRHCCFYRDGWREVIETENGPKKVWFAYCAFDCGTIIWMETATLDHYPIPYKLGGDWVLENLRLACAPCNSGAGGGKDTGWLASIMPQGLNNQEKIEWHKQYVVESARLNGMHGLPIELMYPEVPERKRKKP